MKRSASLFVCLYCLLQVFQCFAQGNIFGFHLTGKRKEVRVPFRLSSNLIIIPVQINAQDTLQFVLDTGVSSSLLVDPGKAYTTNQPYARSVTIDGIGKRTATKANISIANMLTIGNVRAFNHNLVVFDENLLNLSAVLGTPIHGIIGYELFERFAITVNFAGRYLTFREPDEFRYRKSKGNKIPISIVNKKPYLDGVEIGTSAGSKRLNLMIDTGAGHALMLNSASSEIPLPDSVIHLPLGVGLAGEISGYLGRLPLVTIDEFKLANVLSSFPDSASYGSKIGVRGNEYGNIGGELLRRFTITFNYAKGYIILKPIRRFIKVPFEHDMSGIDLRAGGADFNNYFIDHVQKNSPAFQAGLKAGDRILFINNIPSENLELNDIVMLLQKKEGFEIQIVVSRNQEVIASRFVLRSII